MAGLHRVGVSYRGPDRAQDEEAAERAERGEIRVQVLEQVHEEQ
ncbi:hypothetical protein ACIQVK_41200 [Streptomyces sp. NPDC090493]